MKKTIKSMGVLHIYTIFIFILLSLPIYANGTKEHSLHSPPLQEQQKQYSLTGTVTDKYGPLPGVHVLIKGTNTGTFTDKDGGFSLNVLVFNSLVFSYMGYKTLEMSVLGRNTLEIELLPEATQLQEVEVNAGYYTVKERERTGSISRVTAEEIGLQPIVSPLQTLEGRVPGIEVEQGSGITGLAPSIQIRGRNSLRNDGNYPLFIVDGIPINSTPIRSVGQLTNLSGMDPLSTLNLSNIESIEVLKDADATAIYGSRGANGVVLISTKKGKENSGRTILELNTYTGLSQVSNKAKLLNTPQYLSMRRQAFENDGITPTINSAPDLLLWDQGRYTDWQKELFGVTAVTSDVNVAISGGNENTSYLIGGSYHKQGSVIPGDFDYNKITANLNLNHRSENNRFQLDLSLNYGVDNNGLFFGDNFVNTALTTPPNAPPIFKEDGSLNWENWTTDNPLSVLEQPQNFVTDNILANIVSSYTILRGLQLKLNMGYSKLNSQEQIRFFKEAYNPSIWDFIELNTVQGNEERRSWIVEPQVNYKRDFGEINIDALIGGTLQDNKNNFMSMEGSGYVDKTLMGNFEAADEVRIPSNEHNEYRYAALFGRLGLNWEKRYFLNITGRRDGSSRFGPGRRFSNFWALGGAWIFKDGKSNHENSPILSFGKLRGGYGTTGSDQIPDYGYMDTYETTDGVGGLYPTRLYNPDYSWEINKKLEAALQLGFLNDRINLEVNWYRNRSSNQLVGYPLPAITGFTSVQANLPALIQNTGWEVQLATTNITNREFSWQTSVNFTFPQNKLVEFDNIDQTSFANRYRIGHPLNILLRYQYDGIDLESGFYRLVDVNEDGRFNNDDRVVIRNIGREYYGGMHNQIRFNNFSFQFLFEYIKQNNQSSIFSGLPPGFFGNVPKEFLDSWNRSGDNEKIQKLSQSTSALISFFNAANSSIGIEDSSFLRLKNISISFQFPQNLIEKLNIRSGNIFVNAQNVLTLTKYMGLDPQGGRGVVPPLRTITCGVQLKL